MTKDLTLISNSELFHEALFLLEYELDYAGLGGKGCDFSLEMYAVKKLSCC